MGSCLYYNTLWETTPSDVTNQLENLIMHQKAHKNATRVFFLA